MDPKELAKNYDNIAEHWNSPEFDRENGITQHEIALRYSGCKGLAIDIGCGSSGRIIDLLLAKGFEVEGLDLSKNMIEMAKQRHPNILFHRVDICEWKPTKKYAFISAWDSIWHVPLSSQKSVLEKLLNSLEPGGVIVFTTGAVDQAGESCNPFLGQNLYHAVLGITAILELLLINECACRHLENDDWPNKHLFIIAQKNA